MDRAYADDATRRLALDLGSRPKRFHWVDTRCDKLEVIFLATTHLVLIYDMLNSM